MTPAELEYAILWINRSIAYHNEKPWTRTPPLISVGVREVCFSWKGVVILALRPGWTFRSKSSNTRLSPLRVEDVAEAVLVGVA
jgi:hypothetical protein